jgi:hypothetical protein
LEALPEAFFHGWCYEKLKEFYEESEIRFQIHQQSNMDEKQRDFRLHKALLSEGQLHDAAGVVATLFADFEIDDDYLKAPTKKQKSMVEEISEDKSILHPKKKMLDPQKFIKEILQKEIIERLDKTVTYQNSLEFQLKHFEDFFIGSFQMEHDNNASSSQQDGERGQHQNRSSQLSEFSISRNNFYGTDTISEKLKNVNSDSIAI